MDDATRFTNFAKDDYAAQFFSGIPGSHKQISIGWASNWQYTNAVPTGEKEGFRSVMTVPHEHYISSLPRTGLSLISYPHNIAAAFDTELAHNASLGNGTITLDYSNLESRALYWEANITGLTDSSSLTGTLNFTFSSTATGESISGGTFLSTGDLWLDRGRSSAKWSNPFFTDKFSVTGLYDGSGVWRISGIIDRTILEVFLNGGEYMGTSVFYPSEPLDSMEIAIEGINEHAMSSVRVWGLKAAWLAQADVNGIVRGNVTQA
jgi:beta-fructofuranosidase